MFEFVTMFFPSILSTTMVLTVSSKNDDFKEGFGYERGLHAVKLFVFYVLFNNITSLLLYSIFYRVGATVVEGRLNSAFLSLKYVILASIMSLIWGYLGKTFMFKVRLFFSRELIDER